MYVNFASARALTRLPISNIETHLNSCAGIMHLLLRALVIQFVQTIARLAAYCEIQASKE